MFALQFNLVPMMVESPLDFIRALFKKKLALWFLAFAILYVVGLFCIMGFVEYVDGK